MITAIGRADLQLYRVNLKGIKLKYNISSKIGWKVYIPEDFSRGQFSSSAGGRVQSRYTRSYSSTLVQDRSRTSPSNPFPLHLKSNSFISHVGNKRLQPRDCLSLIAIHNCTYTKVSVRFTIRIYKIRHSVEIIFILLLHQIKHFIFRINQNVRQYHDRPHASGVCNMALHTVYSRDDIQWSFEYEFQFSKFKVFFLLVYLCLYKTPIAIRTYAVLILNFAITDFICCIMDWFDQTR